MKQDEQIHAKYRHEAKGSHKAFAEYAPSKSADINAPDPRFQSYGNYLFSNFEDPGSEGYDESKAHPWGSYTGSRMLIRVFSRGLLGATLYTAAHRMLPGQLAGYTAEKALTAETLVSQPMQFVARAFDIGYGTPIKAFTRAFYKMEGKSGKQLEDLVQGAVSFRGKKVFPGQTKGGRSLGAEIVGMTGDFAAGSVGDATGRKIAAVFDPSDPNSWEREDGSIDVKQFAKAFAKDSWQIFSLNQGEDWAAALPYVYQMRWQRQAINRLYKGFKATSDHQLNGGSFRLDQDGHIIDSYAKAGALDLQIRFTGYNWYTLMFRDAYGAISNAISGNRDNDEPSKSEASNGLLFSAVEQAACSFRYVLKSAIKATIYMTPAVPFFWATRTPQTKYKGIGIYLDEEMGIAKLPNGQPFSFDKISPNFKEDLASDVHYPLRHDEPISVGNPPKGLRASAFGPKFDPYNVKHTRGLFDRALNPFGKACYQTADRINRGLRKLGVESIKRGAVHDWVNASASYTPYMIAKAETAMRWDRPKDHTGKNDMDRAIYRMLDGVAALSPNEIRKGMADIREEIIHPDSSGEIEKRMASVTKEEAQEPDTKISTRDISTDIAAPAMQKEDRDWRHKHAQREFMKDTDPEDRVVH